MKKIFLLALCFYSGAIYAVGETLRANIATYMVEDGKVDSDRYFIFYFNYFDLGPKVDLICNVMSITITNKNCTQDTLGGKGFWLKPEYSDAVSNGAENFSCKYRKLNNDTAELVVTEKETDYQITHRLIQNVKTGLLTDYKGQLTKTSSIAKKILTAEYKPLISKSAFSGGWELVELGCKKTSLPALTPEITKK
jgi:hypothetical protein